ncbi:winged helix-turn-helix domain-containing protein [Pelagicoccus sp. SDUM812005]|uniref:helix-turn-helix transcriptional regulator n=1 Tax=Pelagicoccus sp. SDUM812005 TaxID=3041257 RepID=UPI0028103AED|nr:winged helix-turn-helix domain-containing protein [Pelagicoccus sp. SDUM812005]MDQ8180746.1 winged helix-turn-helix domain-containing protein [Pelagicoccus sp. SDUM812005]
MAIESKKEAAPSAKEPSQWTFFSNHAHVLLCLDKGGDKVLRDVAVEVGITERAVQKIVSDLEVAGIITRFKEGRRNRYKINRRVKLRHAIESHRSVGDLLDFVHKD